MCVRRISTASCSACPYPQRVGLICGPFGSDVSCLVSCCSTLLRFHLSASSLDRIFYPPCTHMQLGIYCRRFGHCCAFLQVMLVTVSSGRARREAQDEHPLQHAMRLGSLEEHSQFRLLLFLTLMEVLGNTSREYDRLRDASIALLHIARFRRHNCRYHSPFCLYPSILLLSTTTVGHQSNLHCLPHIVDPFIDVDTFKFAR